MKEVTGVLKEMLTGAGRGVKRFWQRLRSYPPLRPQPGLGLLGVAFGSGGMRGGAHVGVLEALAEQGLEPGLLAGTSAGAVVAALKGAGFTCQELAEAAAKLEPSLFTDLCVPQLRLLAVSAIALRDYLRGRNPPQAKITRGIIQGDRFAGWLRQFLGERRFEDLRVPTYVVATDLVTGDAVVFGPGQPAPELPPGFRYVVGVDVVTAVRASCAIPMIFEPVRAAGGLLVDGAFCEPVPAPVLRSAGAQTVIAVDLGTFCPEGPRQPDGDSALQCNLFGVFGRSAAILSDRYAAERLSRSADIIIRPGADRVHLTDVEGVQASLHSGRAAARQALQAITKRKPYRSLYPGSAQIRTSGG